MTATDDTQRSDIVVIRIPGWEDFQHFKDRNPIWIKIYRGLRYKREWRMLDHGAAKLIVDLWLIASEQTTPGDIDLDNHEIAWEVREDPSDVRRWLEQLESHDFIETISVCHQSDITRALAREETEKRREENKQHVRP